MTSRSWIDLSELHEDFDGSSGFDHYNDVREKTTFRSYDDTSLAMERSVMIGYHNIDIGVIMVNRHEQDRLRSIMQTITAHDKDPVPHLHLDILYTIIL